MELLFSAATVIPNIPDGDVALINGLKSGALGAFEQLYTSHGGRMKSLAAHLLGDRREAEDAVQETFLRVYRAIPGFDGDRLDGLIAWIYRILINCCYDAQRKRQRQRETPLDEFDPAIPNQTSLQVGLRRALARIHAGYRMVFWLFEAEGFRHSEIAAIMEIPEGTSRKWLFEAKRELKKLLSEERS